MNREISSQRVSVSRGCVFCLLAPLVVSLPRTKLVFVCPPSQLFTDEVLPLFTDGAPGDLVLPDCHKLTEDALATNLARCLTPKLETLHLQYCGRALSDAVAAKTLGGGVVLDAPDLTPVVPVNTEGEEVAGGSGAGGAGGSRATTSRAEAPEAEPPIVAAPGLRFLQLRGAYRLSNEGLNAALKGCPRLHSLELLDCTRLTPRAIVNIGRRIGATLHTLTLDGSVNLVDVGLVTVLLQLTALEHLSLRNLPKLTDAHVKDICAGCGGKLRTLRLTNCPLLTDHTLDSVSALCPVLETLEADTLPLVTTQGVEYIANGLPKLHTLSLRQCTGVADSAPLLSLVERCGPGLRHLAVGGIPSVDDRLVVALVTHASDSLTFADFSWCRKVTENAMGLLADSCTRLKHLELWGCTQMTSRFMLGHRNEHLRVAGSSTKPRGGFVLPNSLRR